MGDSIRHPQSFSQEAVKSKSKPAERASCRTAIVKNLHDYHGTIPEKYNALTGSHDVFVEYGNVGTKFAYIATEGFGRMNASFEVGMNYLKSGQLKNLHALKPPPAK